jgi:hypothetical protein
MRRPGVAVDSVHHLLYVAESSDTVQVFDSVTGALQGTVQTPGVAGCAGAANPLTKQAYFVNCGSVGNVTTINFASFNTGTIYAVGNTPDFILLDPRGTLFVANFYSDNLTTIQLPGGARSAIPLGPGAPAFLAEDIPDGLLAVGDPGSPSVTLLNVSDGTPLGAGWVGNATGGVAFDNTSGTFVVSSYTSSAAVLWARLSVPSAPGAPTIIPGNNTLLVNWSAAAGNGPTTYNLTLTPSAGTPLRLVNFTGTSHLFTNLADGVTYAATVTAGNYVGTSPQAGPVDATPVGVPYPPATLKVTPFGSSAVVVWGAPASTDGSPVTNYTVEYTLGTGGPYLPVNEGTALSATIPGLLSGSFYSFRVVAWNAVGASNLSAVVTVATSANAVSVPAGFAGSTAALGIGIGAIVAFAALAVVFILRRRPGTPSEPTTPAASPAPEPGAGGTEPPSPPT